MICTHKKGRLVTTLFVARNAQAIKTALNQVRFLQTNVQSNFFLGQSVGIGYQVNP